MTSRPEVSGVGDAPLLSVSGITVHFGGITALEDVSLDVWEGEVLGLIGPNGAGKTALFNVICGFVAADAGTISWQGTAVRRMRPAGLAKMGIVRTLQALGLFPRMSSLENVMLGATRFRRAGLPSALLGLPRSDRDERALRDRAYAAMQRTDCVEFADRLPGTLPYPIQKRVALARALVAEPKLLLLDEPAGGLDEADMSALAELIDQLRSEISVMLVDHHMDLVTSVCDRVLVLDFGRIIASGEPAEIQENPAVLEAYLGREAEAASGETTAALGAIDADS
jgi:branched-chain amino acid transport system ATP-binding protein